LPEILTPDVGAISTTLEEMIAAAQTIGTRSPEACRARAERHFTHLKMAESYVRMYEAMTSSGTLPAGRPAD